MRFLLESDLYESQEDYNKFTQWLVDNAGVGVDFARQRVEKFKEFKNMLNGQEKDIYYWMKKPVEDFFHKLEELNKTHQEKQKKKDMEQQGAELIYSNNKWKVYHITTYEASCKYGANTKWCITGTKRWNNGDGKTSWEEYAEQGIQMYFFIKNNGEKYALAVYPSKDFEIFDAQDLEMGYIPDAPIIKEIGVNYYTRDDERIIKNLIISNRLPDNLSLRAFEVLLENNTGEGNDIWEITDNVDVVKNWIVQYVPQNYVEHEAVASGERTPEWFEAVTGDEYDEHWGGDLPPFDWGTVNEFARDCKTLNDVLNEKVNPFLKDYKYWVLHEVGDYMEISITGYKSYERLVRDGVYFEVSGSLTFKEFLDYCTLDLIYYIQRSPNKNKYIKELVDLGVSSEIFKEF